MKLRCCVNVSNQNEQDSLRHRLNDLGLIPSNSRYRVCGDEGRDVFQFQVMIHYEGGPKKICQIIALFLAYPKKDREVILSKQWPWELTLITPSSNDSKID